MDNKKVARELLKVAQDLSAVYEKYYNLRHTKRTQVDERGN